MISKETQSRTMKYPFEELPVYFTIGLVVRGDLMSQISIHIKHFAFYDFKGM